MSTGLYVFTMLTYFAGYESVHFGLHYAAKNEPTGAAWGLMHFPVMMHYPVKYGSVRPVSTSTSMRLSAHLVHPRPVGPPTSLAAASSGDVPTTPVDPL